LLHVLADKVYAFNEATLTAGGEQLAAATPNDAQRIRIDGNCVVVSGRGSSPELFTLPSWSSAASSETPSTVRAIAVDGGKLFVLTDHSLEMWSELSGSTPKKRAVR
jgi:selenophosphate synthetase-related protein